MTHTHTYTGTPTQTHTQTTQTDPAKNINKAVLSDVLFLPSLLWHSLNYS